MCGSFLTRSIIASSLFSIMGSEFTFPEDRPPTPRLNDGTLAAFLHDVHHAYLLLHRALKSIPPTVIPDLEPMPGPCLDDMDQPDPLRPVTISSPVPSPILMRTQKTICSTSLRVRIFHTVSLLPKYHHLFDTSRPQILLIFRSLPLVSRNPQFARPRLTRQRRLVTFRDPAPLRG